MAKESEHEERVGQLIAGKYRIERLLGAGGMGAVYVAVHEFTNRKVALKLMHGAFSRSKVAAERFLREARAPSAIGHPGIVEVLDGGREEDGSLYLVLELLQGQTLAEALREESLSPQRVVELGLSLLSALQAAHDAGFVHRDLKPENIFLPDRGESEVKLLDFGVAGILVPETNPNLTVAGAILGTPLYMSPEQAMGRRIDARSDLWSLGAVLYQALSGELPFGGDTVPALIVSISTQPHLPLSVLRPELPRRVAAVIDRALQKSPEQRWPSASAMADALQNALEPARRSAARVRDEAAAIAEPAEDVPRGISGPVVAAAVLLLVLAGLAMTVLISRSRGPRVAAPQPGGAATAPAVEPRPHEQPAPSAPAPAPSPAQAGARAQAPSPGAVPEVAQTPEPPEAPPAAPAPAAPAPAAPARAPLGTEQMQEVITRNQAELQRCYEQSVVKELMQAGPGQADPAPLHVAVRLDIGADGKVRKVDLDGATPPALARCLTDVLTALRFPESSAGAQTGFPMVFQPTLVRP